MIATRARRLAGLALCLVFAWSSTSRALQPAPALRLLFIGNSLTAANDLPGLVATLAEAGGQRRPVTRAVAVGGFSLEDHWNQGTARRAIAEGPWDVVILQQGPSALLESRRLLVEYARRFGEEIRKAGAKPAIYMVWPSLDRQHDFPGVSQSYRAAATAVKGSVFAAGDAWRRALQRHRDIKLYSEDRLHPTFAGSYLAALVIYQGLYEPRASACRTCSCTRPMPDACRKSPRRNERVSGNETRYPRPDPLLC